MTTLSVTLQNVPVTTVQDVYDRLSDMETGFVMDGGSASRLLVHATTGEEVPVWVDLYGVWCRDPETLGYMDDAQVRGFMVHYYY